MGVLHQRSGGRQNHVNPPLGTINTSEFHATPAGKCQKDIYFQDQSTDGKTHTDKHCPLKSNH